MLAQWPRMFEILGQFRKRVCLALIVVSSLNTPAVATRQQLEGDETPSDAPIGGERLVRLPIDELEKEAESKTS